jgi:flagellar motor switch protein FliN/FliY
MAENKTAESVAEEPNGTVEATNANIELVLDIPLALQVQLGEARLPLRDVLRLGPGSVIRLNKSEGDPVELYVNGRLIATGQVVTTPEGSVGVQVNSIVTRMERIRSIR